MVVGLNASVEYDGGRGVQTLAGTAITSLAGSCLVGPISPDLAGAQPKQLTCLTRTGAEEQFTARLGYTLADDRLQLYVLGGIARTRAALNYTFTENAGIGLNLFLSGGARNLTGDVFGAGLEYRPGGSVSYAVEYQYRTFGENAFDNGYFFNVVLPPVGPRQTGFSPETSGHDLVESAVKVSVKYHLPTRR